MRVYQSIRPRLEKAALSYGKRGIPVFPLVPAGKEPMTPRGFYDATTDQDRIIEWWTRWPDANIAMPTGARSGVFVLDIDGDKGHASLAALEAEHGRLPETTTIRTGRGGEHRYFAYPEDGTIPNSASKLGLGIDIRGESGYALLPPSATSGEYRTLRKLPQQAEAPSWLVDLATRRPTVPNENATNIRPMVSLDSSAEPIPEGRRNDTLCRLAGRLHDGTRTMAALTAELLAINQERCAPPLPEVEVLRIANSIYNRELCTPSKKVPDAVIGILSEFLERWWKTPWPGTGGKSRRDAVLTWIVEATQHGTLTPDGDVALSISRRQTAEKMRASVGTAQNAFVWAREHGWVRGGANGPNRKDGHAAGIVLIAPHNAREVEHSPPQRDKTPLDGRGVQVCALPSSRRGRHSAPGLKREATKAIIAVVDHLERAAAWLGEDDIAERMGVSRVRDVRRRYLHPLLEASVVECSETVAGRAWRLAEGWQTAVQDMHERDEALERAAYGGMSSDERQRERHGRERDGYRNRYENKPDISPSDGQLARAREGWRDRQQASGEIADLERVPEPLPLNELYSLMNKPVRTSAGRGRLWQAFAHAERVGVVLDETPGVVTFLHPLDVLGAA